MIPEDCTQVRALAADLLNALETRHWRLGTAESLTGGMLGEMITAIPGASACYAGGVVSYTDRTKSILLGVTSEMLAEHGAVSAEVAVAMAKGCREKLEVQVALATTGVAGPASDGRGTAVGTVFVACVMPDSCVTKCVRLTGDRNRIRLESTRAALELGIQLVEEEK